MEINTASPLTIRFAAEEDIPLLLDWRRAMFLDMGSEEAFAVTLPQFDEWLSSLWEEPINGVAVIGTLGDIPVTCAVAFIHAWFPGLHDISTRRGYILNVYTVPEFRRLGYAGQAVQACVAWLRERDIMTIGLHASAKGASLYHHLGFCLNTLPEMYLRG